MNWKKKAKIQNIIARLPKLVSYFLYYKMQRNFGGLRVVNPVIGLLSGMEIWKAIQKQKANPKDKIFLEIGTGRDALAPLAYWLMGAKKIITIDLNPYIKSELITEHLDYISDNKNEIKQLFGSLLYKNRFNELVEFHKKNVFSIQSYFEFCNIEYIAPGDAENSGLKVNSIDFHVSYNVFEHIPEEILKNIIKEGNKIIKDDGLFVHKVDYSDHFSHSDNSISSINFLQYSDLEWDKYAGNKYMYMNRVRHDDFIKLFEECGHNILYNEPNIDKWAMDLLGNNKIQINEKFKLKDNDILATINALIVSSRSTN